MNRSVRMRVKRTLFNEDRGIALPMVLLVFVVGIALISAFLVAIVGSSRVTASSKANVQAQAAAEAGIAAGWVQLNTGDPCTVLTTPLPDTDLKYSVSASCNAAKTLVTVTSVGTAPNGQSLKVEAVYGVTPATSPQPTAGGPGLFYAASLSSRLNGYVFDPARSEYDVAAFAGAGSVYTSSGNFSCGSGSTFPADVVVGGGNAQIDSGCVIQGNALVSGTMELNGGTVEGNIVATGTARHKLTGQVGKAGANGNVTVAGPFTLNGGTLEGTATATGTGSTTLGSGKVKGNFLYRDTYTTWGTPASSIVNGTVTKNPSLAAPTFPGVPPWNDVAFGVTQQAAWVSAGFAIVTVPAGECGRWNGNGGQNPIWSSLSADLKKTVYDVRACTNVSTNNGLSAAQKSVNLRADIAIIAKGGTLTGMNFTSTNNQTMWFITPDGNPAAAGPQCSGSDWIVRSNTVGNKAALYLYTPCTADFNTSGQWRGQIYSGDLNFGGGVTIAFAPRSIPGYDFTGSAPGGGGAGGATGPTLGTLVSQRNIN